MMISEALNKMVKVHWLQFMILLFMSFTGLGLVLVLVICSSPAPVTQFSTVKIIIKHSPKEQ